MVPDADPFRQRPVILHLWQLEGPEERRGSRATRDGRHLLVTQHRLATCFGVPQPDLSRWGEYWRAGDWANLLPMVQLCRGWALAWPPPRLWRLFPMRNDPNPSFA
jgi:hypothetical protein